MPQMGPILWLNMFIFFTLAFLLTIIMTFYFKLPLTPEKLSQQSNTPYLYWKW